MEMLTFECGDLAPATIRTVQSLASPRVESTDIYIGSGLGSLSTFGEDGSLPLSVWGCGLERTLSLERSYQNSRYVEVATDDLLGD